MNEEDKMLLDTLAQLHYCSCARNQVAPQEFLDSEAGLFDAALRRSAAIALWLDIDDEDFLPYSVEQMHNYYLSLQSITLNLMPAEMASHYDPNVISLLVENIEPEKTNAIFDRIVEVSDIDFDYLDITLALMNHIVESPTMNKTKWSMQVCLGSFHEILEDLHNTMAPIDMAEQKRQSEEKERT